MAGGQVVDGAAPRAPVGGSVEAPAAAEALGRQPLVQVGREQRLGPP